MKRVEDIDKDRHYKIYRYHTNIEGHPVYGVDKQEEHPMMQGEYPDEISYRKTSLINFIFSVQESRMYTITELRQMPYNEVRKIADDFVVIEQEKLDILKEGEDNL